LGAEAGGGAGASLAGEEVGPGADDEVLEGEAACVCRFVSGADRTKGSDHPVSSEPVPVLLAPISSCSGGEEVSSAWRCFFFGAAHPELVSSHQAEDGALPAPERAGLE
jgi:hypothetical protein